jgi:tetratricopeptide (TPR) repeat protein
MKKKRTGFYFLSALTLLLLHLAGCGGNENYISSSSSSATVPFNGVVEDGPIAGAKISLRDKDGTYYPLYDSLGHANYEVRTDENGAFALAVKAGIDFSNLSVHAIGGIDRDTGMDFSGLEMRSPLALFNSDVSAIVVSPLTTLVAELHVQGFSFAEADKILGDWLFPTADVDLAASPSTNLDLQRRTLLLSKIALESTEENPFALISKQILTAATLVDVIGNPTIMSALGIVDTETQIQITKLQTLLASAATLDDMFTVFKREELRAIFENNFKEILELSSPFDVQQNLNYQKNVELLAEKILSAAGSEVFLLVDPIPSRLFRYVFFTYLVSMPESSDQLERLKKRREMLTLDPLTFPATLTYSETDFTVALENDPWITLLARSSSANSADSPLLLNELPGDDNQKRLAYFYASDLSPHFQAEQLIGKVFDDTVNDAVMVKVAEGKSNAGLVEEARIIIATQIIQGEKKANAYRTLGNALITFGHMAEARDELLRARDLYFTKGKTNDITTDSINLKEMAYSFSKAGYPDDAKTVLQYLSKEVDNAEDANPAAISQLVAGYKKVADAYIAAGDLEAAAPVVDLHYVYAQKVPLSNETYWTRVISLGNTAKFYADLGNREKVVQIYGQIESLRWNGSVLTSTGAVTWYLIPPLVETLYRVGETGEASLLANSIPASKASDRTKAFKLLATIEALNGNLNAAYAMVFGTYFPKPEDKVEVLTYKESNKNSEYIGLALIKAGRIDEARIALTKAEDVLAGMTQVTDQNRYTYLIQRGYVKVADLYFMIGDLNKAAALLQQARGVVDQISGVKFVVDGLIDIALGCQQIGQPGVTLSLLQDAGSRVDAITGGALVLPKDMALLYEALIKAYFKIGDNDHAYGKVTPFLQWSYDIHTPGLAYIGTANDDLASTEVAYLLKTAKYLVSTGYRDEALSVLNEAKATANLIIVDTSRLLLFIHPEAIKYPDINHLIGGYANARAYDQALALALGLADTTSRNQAIGYLAGRYVSRDDFPGTWVASIDIDGDGKPDFFNPLASADELAASGLILDDDCDGDGIIDTLDIRPLFKD